MNWPDSTPANNAMRREAKVGRAKCVVHFARAFYDGTCQRAYFVLSISYDDIPRPIVPEPNLSQTASKGDGERHKLHRVQPRRARHSNVA